jgi:putative hydrolase of the HAD superfamily
LNKLKYPNILFDSIEAVIFDVDGTLYNQKKLKVRMLLSLLHDFWKVTNMITIFRVLKSFRGYRERVADSDTDSSLWMQYEWVARNTNTEIELVRRVVEEWMFRKPLSHIGTCLHDGVADFFDLLKEKKMKVGIYSDYPSLDKLAAMALHADVYVCSTDQDVLRLKPSPKGLLICCRKLKVLPENTLYIGDRDDHDGECARRANVPYIILPGDRGTAEHFYYQLIQRFTGI